jgi:hypothetical protein
MPRHKSVEPKYCHHKSVGLAYVTINKKETYLLTGKVTGSTPSATCRPGVPSRARWTR